MSMTKTARERRVKSMQYIPLFIHKYYVEEPFLRLRGEDGVAPAFLLSEGEDVK